LPQVCCRTAAGASDRVFNPDNARQLQATTDNGRWPRREVFTNGTRARGEDFLLDIESNGIPMRT